MPESIFNSQAQHEIVAAIKEAERATSGEIRVHVDNKCPKPVLDQAAYMFAKLKMHKTKLRNGVLFYIAIEDHQFAIIGDVGINTLVPDHFWDEIRDTVINYFKQGNYTEGLTLGIQKAGQQLSEHFPYERDNFDELDNAMSFGKH